MDGETEVNEAVESSAADALQIKRVDVDRPLPEQSNPNNAEQTDAPVVYEDTEWSEHFSMLQSSVIFPEVVAGQSLNCHPGSHSGSQPHYSSANSLSNPAERVEELTLKNFRNPNLSIGGGTSSGEKPRNRMSLWQNFTKLTSKSRDKAPGISLSVDHTDDLGNRLLLHSDAQRPVLATQSEPQDSRLSELTINKPIVQSTTPTQSPVAIRTKVLSSSGFQQYLVKTTLKGKGITCQGNFTAPGPVISPQVIERPNANVEITSKSSHCPTAKVNATSFDDLGASNAFEERITLREWLKPKCQKINKAERTHIFKQIVNLVDICHSQQLVFQHLQPSYFVMLPSDQVKYIGSFVPQHQMDFPVSANQYIHYLDNWPKRKRITDMHKETSEVSAFKHHKLQYQHRGGMDHHKYSSRTGFGGDFEGEDNEVDTMKKSTSEFSVFKLDTRHSFSASFSPQISSSSSQHSKYDLLKLEESWYASPEEINDRIFSFKSNIYSLGVLLFELFCCFETWELHTSALLNLRHRILPPTFLSESPKEAGFCLWLLHPDPSSRPKSRDILQSDLLSGSRDLLSLDSSSALVDEEDAESDLLLHFLLSLKEHKEKMLLKLETQRRCLNADIEESQRRQLLRTQLFSDHRDLNYLSEKPVGHAEIISLPSKSNEYKERLMKNSHQLECAYFSRFSRTEAAESTAAVRFDCNVLKIQDKYSHIQYDDDETTDSLGTFFDGLCKYARYSKFEVCGNVKNVDILNSANVICSLSFDRDEEYFAAAGVSRKIKIFEFSALLNDSIDLHYPVLEMTSRSKLSCVSWNNYIKNYLASTDYEGAIQLWDACVGQGFTRFIEHQKRAWSVNFSVVDPTKLASGGDDCTVKLWSINESSSIDTIRNVANVCCVQFSYSHLLAFGSADYKIYCYDLRNTRIPWCTLSGHGKAVSYVKFVDSETLVSASTDNTLKIWDLKRTNPCGLSNDACSLTLSGHTNEKNFVGLSVYDGYIVCGSETNEVYAYYKTFPMPMATHKFGSVDPITAQETSDDGGHFVSSVCWRGRSNMVVTANSTGRIKVLRLV